jgi:histone acetyltransferase (RNA polymerase elongator complex component)
VIKGTALAKMLEKGKYSAMTTDEAVSLAAKIYLLFQKHKVNVLRMGLYTSEDLENDIIAGPDMKHFKEKVMTFIWKQILEKNIDKSKANRSIEIFTAKDQLNFVIGYMASNRKSLLQIFPSVKFKASNKLTNNQFYVDYC